MVWYGTTALHHSKVLHPYRVALEAHPDVVLADDPFLHGWVVTTCNVARRDAQNVWPAMTPRNQGLELRGVWEDRRQLCQRRGNGSDRRWAAVNEATFLMLRTHRREPVELCQGQESLATHLLAVPQKDARALRLWILLEDDWCMEVVVAHLVLRADTADAGTIAESDRLDVGIDNYRAAAPFTLASGCRPDRLVVRKHHHGRPLFCTTVGAFVIHGNVEGGPPCHP